MRITSVGGCRPPDGGKASLVPAQRSRIERVALAAGRSELGLQELDGIGYATAELREDAQIRPLLLNADRRQRSRAHVQATLQDALCLAVADNTDEGQRVLAHPR